MSNDDELAEMLKPVKIKCPHGNNPAECGHCYEWIPTNEKISHALAEIRKTGEWYRKRQKETAHNGKTVSQSNYMRGVAEAYEVAYAALTTDETIFEPEEYDE